MSKGRKRTWTLLVPIKYLLILIFRLHFISLHREWLDRDRHLRSDGRVGPSCSHIHGLLYVFIYSPLTCVSSIIFKALCHNRTNYAKVQYLLFKLDVVDQFTAKLATSENDLGGVSIIIFRSLHYLGKLTLTWSSEMCINHHDWFSV